MATAPFTKDEEALIALLTPYLGPRFDAHRPEVDQADRAARILIHRYCRTPRTILRELGPLVSLSPARARAVEHHAIRKLTKRANGLIIATGGGTGVEGTRQWLRHATGVRTECN